MDVKERSPHILNASATLLGFCFIVFTTIKVLNVAHTTIIDEIAAFASILFMLSSILSYISLRSKKDINLKYERFGDIVFLSGLFLLLITIFLIVFNFIK